MSENIQENLHEGVHEDLSEKLTQIVLEAIHAIGETEEKEELLNPTEDLRLFGGRGVMDSLGVVMLITDLEEQVEEQFDQAITLADDRAMSQKTSPFRSVKTLVNYIVKLLEEEG